MGQQYGWLIFGVRNKDRVITGTDYRNTLGLDKLKQEILRQPSYSYARNNFKKNANKQHISEEIDNMSDDEFLTKLKLIINGKITNAAMVKF